MANAVKKPVTQPSQESLVERSKLKAENFKRLASKRMSRALASLNGVKQLSNRSSYNYDDLQVTKILNALKGAVNEIETAYKTPQASAAKATFEL